METTNSKNSEFYDVIVAGLGPSGSVAAVQIAKNGHSVLLIDKEDFPRNKICGDGLIGDSIRILKEIGLWELIEKNSYKSDFLEVFHHSNKSAVFDLPIYTIKRKTFDNHLLNAELSASMVNFLALSIKLKL